MTTIDRIDPAGPDGTFSVRFLKTNGGYHRTTFLPGESVDAQMAAVNAHLQQMGHQPIASHAAINARAAQEHTPARVTAFRTIRGNRGANHGQPNLPPGVGNGR